MSNSDNHNSSHYPITETNMLVDMIANSEKLFPENKRWQYNGEKNPELDDDHSNYVKNNESERRTDNNTETHRTDTYNNSHTDNRTDNKTANDTVKRDDGDDNLTAEELMLRKLDMLRKLSELAQAGVKLSQNYNMNSDYKMMKYEYELHKGIRAKQNGINWMSSMSLNLIYGIEMLNDKYNPFDLKLKGWSEQMAADQKNYYDVFGELYEKYNQPGKNMAPELKLLLMVSGSALKFHLTNTMMSSLPTLNTQLDEDPILAEQLRQKAIAQKLKEQNNKNNEALKNNMDKEHEIAAQKAYDLNLIRQKELEFQNLKRENAQKNAELEALREKLIITKTQQNTQNNSHVNFPKAAVVQSVPTLTPNLMQQNQLNMPNQQTMKVPPMVQRMMMARQQQQNQQSQYQDQLQQQWGLGQNQTVNNKLNNLRAQTSYMEELEKIKNLRQEEEKRLKEIERRNQRDISSESSSVSNKSSKSSVEYNVNLKNILSDTKNKMNKDITNSSEKITSLGVVSKDEISMSNISLGKKRVKKDKESRDSKDSDKTEKSNKSDKPKNVRQKKTGITLE